MRYYVCHLCDQIIESREDLRRQPCGRVRHETCWVSRWAGCDCPVCFAAALGELMDAVAD